MNLLRGAANLVEDFGRGISGKAPPGSEAFLPGRDVMSSNIKNRHHFRMARFTIAIHTLRRQD